MIKVSKGSCCNLVTCHVLIRNLSEQGGPGKLQAYWENKFHRVVERLGDGPETEFKLTGHRTLRVPPHNLLLPVNDLRLEHFEKDCHVQQKPRRQRYHHTQDVSDSAEEEGEYSYSLRHLPVYEKRTVKLQPPLLELHSKLRAVAPEYQPRDQDPTEQQKELDVMPDLPHAPTTANAPSLVELQEP